ncbi:MAG: hypothetical protein LBT26_03100 [Clostridiales Family XIII bacterium]|jgi:hypothetical protein|nr:hypothetical protein [Clostridiales Family XIII bacterium]
MAKNSKRGSLTVEAAIFLPLFIISILTISYLIKFLAVQENVMHSLADEAHSLAAAAVYTPYPIFFENDAEKRISQENGDEIENFEISLFLYRFRLLNYSEQIRITADYDIGVKLPLAAIDRIPASVTVLCRAFTGKDNAAEPMPVSEIEEEKESVTVWIFPRAGTKYHGENCAYIKVYPRETALSESVRRQYEPCKLCKPGELSNGSLVYCFQKSGEVFHSGSCTSVERYVVSIEKEEAEARGYSPCSKCGGQ